MVDIDYKIDIRKISEITKKINPNASKLSLLSLLIPIYNIMKVYERTIVYYGCIRRNDREYKRRILKEKNLDF